MSSHCKRSLKSRLWIHQAQASDVENLLQHFEPVGTPKPISSQTHAEFAITNKSEKQQISGHNKGMILFQY